MNELNHDLPESSPSPEGSKRGQKIKHFVIFFLKLCGAFILFALLSSLPLVLLDGTFDFPPTLAVIISIALVIIYVKIWQREKADYSMEELPFPQKMWLYLLGMVPGFMAIMLLLMIPLDLFFDIPNDTPSSVEMFVTTQEPWIVFFCVVIIAPIFEEIFFRGVLLNRLRTITSVKRAIIISSAVFGLIHAPTLSVLSAIVFGLIIGFVYVKCNSLRVTMLVHAANNCWVLFIGYGLEYIINNIPLVENIYLDIFFSLFLLAILGISIYCAHQLYRFLVTPSNSVTDNPN